MEPVFDYLVIRDGKKFGTGEGVILPLGTRLHGDVVGSWGQHSAYHLTNAGLISEVPHDPGAEHYNFGNVAVAEVVPDDDDEPRVEDSATLKQSFPHHVGGGRFELSDGSTVVGKQAAQSAQAKLELA